MVDRGNARADRGENAGRAVAVRSDLDAVARGFGHHRLELVVCELLGPDRGFERENASRRANLIAFAPCLS